MDLSQSSKAATPHRLFGRNVWLALFLLLPFLWCASGQGTSFSLYLFQTQDMLVIAGLVAALLVTEIWAPNWSLPKVAPSVRLVAGAGLCLALLLWWGCYALLGNVQLSRDEHMAVFDMAVFAHGHLAEPIAAQWRPYAENLVPAFLLNPVSPTGLISTYLPGNSLLRLAFSYVADPALMNPLLTLCGGLALLDIARRLFDKDARIIWVVMIVYGLSAQMAANAMTTYAMTGHMALNLMWLAAFLRGGRWGHCAAILLGFVAAGLHQIVFHPLFVAPFILWRLREGHWRLVFGYGAAYALILGWWMAYPLFPSLQAGAAALGAGAQDSFFADRVLPLLMTRDPMTIPDMTLNLLRFVSWQHLALLPLMAAAAPLALRTRDITAPLFWGIVLAILFFGFILPFQGHGWGYRYLHPWLGCCALLAGFGYRRLVAERGRAADGMVLLLSLGTLLVSLPYLLERQRAFYAPQVALDHLATRQHSDFVLMEAWRNEPPGDGRWVMSAVDAVQNRPDLSNRPLRFSTIGMTPQMLAQLCRRGTMTVITRTDMRALGFPPNTHSDPARLGKLVSAANRTFPGCFKRPD